MTYGGAYFQGFISHAITVLEPDPALIGLAAGGSWITGEMDDYSDLDLVLVTEKKITSTADKRSYAGRFGNLVSAFTGEHVGEPRLLICLYAAPLIHVDIKFLDLEELVQRVEDPVVVLDKGGRIQEAIRNSRAVFPLPDYQWIEDRFWTWVHYLLTKIGRGEYFEAHDFLAFFRGSVFGPLLHLKNGNLPRGVRKVEVQLAPVDLALLTHTIGGLDKPSLILATETAISLYRSLRGSLFGAGVIVNERAEEEVLRYFYELRSRIL